MVKDRSVFPENDSKHKSKHKLVRIGFVDDEKIFTRGFVISTRTFMHAMYQAVESVTLPLMLLIML